jgi:putative chitinase
MLDDQLKALMPRLPAAKRATLLPFMQAAMREFEINSAAREAAFAAQLAHESGQFQFMEEIWGPTDAQRRYEPPATLASRLGNTEPGDGKRFKGRGPIQITGRANYARFGSLLSVDLLVTPDLAAQPELGFRIAALFWKAKKLNELADQVTADAFKEITRRINGGFNGLADREAFYTVAKTVMGVAAPSLSRGSRRSPASVPDPVFTRGQEAIARDEEEPQPRPRVPRAAKKTWRRAPRNAKKTRTRRATAKKKPQRATATKKPQRRPARSRKKSARR